MHSAEWYSVRDKLNESTGRDCIVSLVQRRVTAFVIVDMLRTLGDHVGFIRACAVVGHGRSSNFPQQVCLCLIRTLCTYTWTTQQEIFRSFSKGSYNLLIATKAAEDLDMPKANIVIRFVVLSSHVVAERPKFLQL
jgi:endoribonuclease Dicer